MLAQVYLCLLYSNDKGHASMKKSLIIIVNILSAIVILDSLNALHAIIYFVIAGQIPGTSVYLDSDTMLALCMVPLGFIFGRLSTRAFELFVHAKQLKRV